MSKGTKYCRHCGEKIDYSSSYCTKCGEKQELVTTKKLSAEQKRSVKSFSWGFLLLPFFYSWAMKFTFIEVIGALILQSLPNFLDDGIGILLYLLIAIPVGFKAKEYAWSGKRIWESYNQFTGVQKSWTIAGVIVNILAFLLPFFLYEYY